MLDTKLTEHMWVALSPRRVKAEKVASSEY